MTTATLQRLFPALYLAVVALLVLSALGVEP